MTARGKPRISATTGSEAPWLCQILDSRSSSAGLSRTYTACTMAKSELSSKLAGKAVKKARIAVPVTKKVSVRERKGTPPPKLKSEKSKPIASSSKDTLTKPSNQKISSKAQGKKKSTAEEDEPVVLPSSFKIVAGSYEKLLYGLNGSTSVDEDGKLQYQLKPIFIFPAHVSCIKAVAASPNGGKWLASGSADEIIKIWDLRRRKEVGGLMHHEGTSCSVSNVLCILKSVHRLYHTTTISLTVAFAISLGGWYSMSVQGERLVGLACSEGP
jgi:WD40 repeat protein